MTTQEIVAILLAVLGGGVGKSLLDWIRDFRSGKAQERRADIDRLATVVAAAKAAQAEAEAGEVAAVAEKDIEAAHRRMLQEHASEMRRRLISDHGVAAADLPEFPSRPHSTQ